MSKKSIASRWFINSFVVVALLLLVVDVSVFFALQAFYYNGVKQYLNAEAGTIHNIIDYMSDYTSDFRRTVEEFDKKSHMELMTLSSSGKVVLTSSGFSPNISYDMPDYTQAKESAAIGTGGVGEHVGYMPNSEKYMAVTIMLPDKSASGQSAIRLVTSLEKVDNQIYSTALIIGALSIAVLLLVLFLGLYFVKSIVSPIRQIGNSARRLARGDFTWRITPSKNDDEISELCQIFNYMAEELENSETIKNDFISSVSHELRTPLTAIKGWGETILMTQSQMDTEQPLKTYIEVRETLDKGMRVIVTETERLSGMVEELLDFSKIQSGHLTLQKTNFDVLAELADALLVYTDRARRENVSIAYQEPEAVAMFYGDKNRIRQVFINIIDNAIKYSAPDSRIVIDVTISSTQLLISVSDNGCGISEADLPKVKNKFYKANTSVRGSGIGLAVADEIITQHGGLLDITSKLGEGTTVQIQLPLLQKKLSPPTEG